MSSSLRAPDARRTRFMTGVVLAALLAVGSIVPAAPARAAASTRLVPASQAERAWQCRHISPHGSEHLRPWPAKIRSRVSIQFGRDDIGGYRPGNGSSDHHTGNALDVMVRGDAGDEIADWFREHAEELNVKYVIWEQGIWFPGRRDYRPMADRGSETQNHYDHVHISFNDGAGTCPDRP